MAVTTIKNITDELNAMLEENLEGILANVENGNYEYYVYGGDHVMVILVEPLVFVLARITSSLSTGEPLTITEITDDNNFENIPDLVAPVENDVMLKGEYSIMSVEEHSGVEPAEETGEQNSCGPSGGPEPTEARKRLPPRRSQMSMVWKSVKRVFRFLCCCGCRSD
ncbi:unnamed protein product [Macrosiphum euphorbiae]|uniref:Uncharacterized protein n=1 Tax=Macrosiphum euphorbiae TaxID=13131 RepID=A0AAV0Y9V4_9HEMI|nr:unnamed protein product [Macrosiphum euphorbiae]